ncbi:MAG: hypothetical protein AB7N71_07505 [Phycisphaerae bacterium]
MQRIRRARGISLREGKFFSVIGCAILPALASAHSVVVTTGELRPAGELLQADFVFSLHDLQHFERSVLGGAAPEELALSTAKRLHVFDDEGVLFSPLSTRVESLQGENHSRMYRVLTQYRTRDAARRLTFRIDPATSSENVNWHLLFAVFRDREETAAGLLQVTSRGNVALLDLHALRGQRDASADPLVIASEELELGRLDVHISEREIVLAGHFPATLLTALQLLPHAGGDQISAPDVARQAEEIAAWYQAHAAIVVNHRDVAITPGKVRLETRGFPAEASSEVSTANPVCYWSANVLVTARIPFTEPIDRVNFSWSAFPAGVARYHGRLFVEGREMVDRDVTASAPSMCWNRANDRESAADGRTEKSGSRQ